MNSGALLVTALVRSSSLKGGFSLTILPACPHSRRQTGEVYAGLCGLSAVAVEDDALSNTETLEDCLAGLVVVD